MAELLDIGNCLIDAALVVAVEPHRHGRHASRIGALIRLSGGETVIEESGTLKEVKAAIQAARKPAKPFAPHRVFHYTVCMYSNLWGGDRDG